MNIQEMERLGKTTANPGNHRCQWLIITKKPHACAMHAKNNNEIIHGTWYLQEKPTIVANTDVLLHFPSFPLPSISNSQVIHTPPRKLQVTKSMREIIEERELQAKTDKRLNGKKPWIDPQKPFYQWGLYFLHFPLFSFIFLLTWNLWPFTFLFSYFPLFS